MRDETIDIASLRSPLPKIKFPNGRVLPLAEATALTERLRRDVVADPTNETKVRAVLRNLVPDATEDDWETCTSEDVANIYQIALRKHNAVLQLVEDRRKNESGGTPARRTRRRTPPSSPTTTSVTSAPASGESAAEATGT